MGKIESKRDALNIVLDAADIHSKTLTESLSEYGMQAGFKRARVTYIGKLQNAVAEARMIRLDSDGTISQRVADLDLEEATDLLHAVEDHIRSLRRNKRSEFR